MGKFSIIKRSALVSNVKALPRNCRLSRNSVRSTPRKRATRSRHCGISASIRSVAPNSTTAARNSAPSLINPRPRNNASGSRVPGSSARPRRIASSTVRWISAISRSSTDQPRAGWFSPTLLAVHPFEQHLIVLVTRHSQVGIFQPGDRRRPCSYKASSDLD